VLLEDLIYIEDIMYNIIFVLCVV